jgi:predicted Zn-dependent protease with MMP-like domain
MKPDKDVDDLLDRIEDLYAQDDLHAAGKELARARKLFPEDLSLQEWEAVLAAEDGRFEKALRILDRVLAQEPDRPFAARERADVLVELCRPAEALEQLTALIRRRSGKWDAPEEEADARFALGACLDRLGRIEEADAELKKASRLAPEDFPNRVRMPQREFEALVSRAIDSIPGEFRRFLKQVAIVVRDYPPSDAPSPTILGLYSGLPRTERTHEDRDHLDTVFVFKRNHELQCLGTSELSDEVRKTVIHEIAHHFGLGEDDMGDYA